MSAPFLKWAGGKRQLLPELLKAITPNRFRHYYEPFVGGGALFFELRNRGFSGNATLGDMNELLIRTYLGVRNDVECVIEYLRGSKYSKKEYYEKRALCRSMYSKADFHEVAAWLIYMNKCCFNGLWRVNKKGEFNVPMGRYTNLTICDEQGLKEASSALRKTKILHVDFEKVVKSAEAGDFVYFDPPYLPVNETSNFTGYTRDGFTWDDQVRLRDCAKRLRKLGVYVILSNADLPEIRKLYKEFKIRRVEARRAINSKASKRGVVGEVIIT